MIPRYSRPEMAAIWSPETRFRIWFEIEAHALDAMAAIGVAPKSAAETVRRKGANAKFDVARIDAIERDVKHDVIAFLTHVAEIVGPEARYLHQGLTSSDVVDTCLAVQLVRATDLLIADVDALLAALHHRAHEHKRTITIGRSHGMHAEPTTFGVKLAVAYAEFVRARRRLHAAREEVGTAALSGAVGTFANLDPRVEEHVARALGLRPEPVSTQVIPRDRHATYFTTLAVVASSIERLATEVRHLQRTEVGEVEEYFSPGQKGSSAMPHKRNPWRCEQLCGLARVLRANLQAGLEDIALWHERDISHSSVERIVLADSAQLAYYVLVQFGTIVRGMRVHPDRMLENLDSSYGLVFSQPVLLALVDAGRTRDEAYRIVQRAATRTWEERRPFRSVLGEDPDVLDSLSPERLDECF
jgi:adenylosuccinate lyase